ncbi:hypothetical protein [Natrinema soli]|uniref:Transposase n=1 Tax=Natrinema soli TaxID=1930624 RepID=A0ABD5SU85_9EURY|nr:hypothetical protein [Natrinema soli]
MVNRHLHLITAWLFPYPLRLLLHEMRGDLVNGRRTLRGITQKP